MTSDLKLALMRAVIAVFAVIVIVWRNPISDLGYAIFLVPLMFVAIYIWLGVLFFFADMIWKLIAMPEERLFAAITLGGTVFITAAIIGAYWLIKDSLGIAATIAFAIGAYFVFSIVRWFRRHTASYYAALETEESDSSVSTEGS